MCDRKDSGSITAFVFLIDFTLITHRSGTESGEAGAQPPKRGEREREEEEPVIVVKYCLLTIYISLLQLYML